MALLDIIGFEQQSFTAGIEVDSNTGPPTIDTVTTYSGGASMRVNGTSVSKFFTKQFTGTNVATDKFFQFRFRIHDASGSPASGTGSAIALFRDATSGNNISVRMLNTRVLQLFNEQTSAQVGSNSTALTVDTWYRIGLRYNRAAGTCELVINGVVAASGSCSATLSSDTVRLGMIDTATCDLYFDDVIITDSSGSNLTSYAGDVKIHTLFPTGAGEVNTFATQTGGTAGSANNYTRVDEHATNGTPDDATTLNGSSTLNQEDLFDVTDPPSDMGDTIYAYVVGFRFRNSTADATAAIKVELEKANGGTKTLSSAIVPNSTTFRTNVASTTLPKTYPIIAYQNPDAVNWTASDITNSRFGYKLTTGPGTAGRRIDVTAIWGHVIYLPLVTTTQTITGVSRIQESVSQNILGKSRIQESVSQTILGKSRIQQAVNKTITGLSRVTASTLRTITGKAAIQETTTQTVTGKSRIQETSTQTITGKSRIQEVVNQTITGKARIQESVSQTITGKSRIQETTTQTITGKSRIQEIVNQTITGLSQISGAVSKNITGKARIQESVTQDITGKSRIQEVVSQTITGQSRIQESVNQAITGKSRIQETTTQTITGLSRIQESVSKTITGKSRIQEAVNQTITGKSRIQEIVSQVITGKARIQEIVLQTISGKSRITSSTNQTITGKAAIRETTAQTIPGKARIQLVTTQNITGKSFIVAPTVSGLGATNTVLQQQRDAMLLQLLDYHGAMRQKDAKTFLKPRENTTVLRMNDN